MKIVHIGKITDAACKVTGCKYKLIKKNGDPPLYTKETEKIVLLAKKAAIAAGIKFSLLALPATIQGNTLSAKGYAVLGLSKGGRFPHSKTEEIRIKELEQTKRLIIEIVKQSKEFI